MELDEASKVLGVRSGATRGEIRSAYRALIRTQHPDVAGPAANDWAAHLNEAYATLRAPDRQPIKQALEPTETSTAQPESILVEQSDTVMLVDDDTVAFAFPADEVFELLIAVAEELGEISYLDRNNSILEVIAAFEGRPVCSVVLTLQCRDNQVEAFTTIETLDGSEPPPIADVMTLLFGLLRRKLQETGF